MMIMRLRENRTRGGDEKMTIFNDRWRHRMQAMTSIGVLRGSP
jgi:hypothetical protein